jgi:plastocyanin
MGQTIKRARATGVLRAGLATLALAVPLAAFAPGAVAATAKTAASHSVAISANTSGLLKFSTTKLSTSAGSVTFKFTNKSPIPHDFVVAKGSKVEGKTPVFKGGTKSFTVTLAKGKYTYYCSVPGHEQAGMKGTLTVS